MKARLREVTTNAESSFKVKVFEDKEFKAEWHFHPQYELTYIVQSTGIRYVGDSMQPFGPGDLVLVGKNLPHSWKTIDSKSEYVKCIVIQWDETLLEDWLDKPEFFPLKSMLQKSWRGLFFDRKTAFALEDSLVSIAHQSPFERLITLLNILNHLATQSNMKFVAGPNFGKSLSSKESERINLINDYIKNNIQNQYSLTEISEKISMSKEAFCRFFKKTFDKTFSNYVNEYKITTACKMLIETDLSISEIGYCSGFNNLSFFHNQFKKHKAITPKNYRLQYQNI